jgi:hypothetical protein
MAKAMPKTVPDMPFALSRLSSGTSRVTAVGRAMFRMLPAMTPDRRSTTIVQSRGLVTERKASAGEAAWIASAIENRTRVATLEISIAVFFR